MLLHIMTLNVRTNGASITKMVKQIFSFVSMLWNNWTREVETYRFFKYYMNEVEGRQQNVTLYQDKLNHKQLWWLVTESLVPWSLWLLEQFLMHNSAFLCSCPKEEYTVQWWQLWNPTNCSLVPGKEVSNEYLSACM